MRMERTEFARRHSGSLSGDSQTDRRVESAKVARQVEKFLKGGGKIETVARGASAFIVDAHKGEKAAEKKKRANAGSRASTAMNRTGSRLWLRNAAQHCKIPENRFREIVHGPNGPLAVQTTRSLRTQFEISSLDSWMRTEAYARIVAELKK